MPQVDFGASRFDAGRFNLHRHEHQTGPPPTLVILVHGLGGRGYETWGNLPERLFDGDGGPALDVGVFDYRSGLRGMGRQAGKFEFWLHQLVGHLRELETEYTDIVLVGHSLGGLLIEAVAKDYLVTRALQGQEGAGSLATLILIASPRAGSGWAVPVGQVIIPEFVVLRRLGARSADVDEFFSTYVNRHNVAGTRPGVFDLPVYAALGGGDKLVSQFSAAFGVPKEQRLYLEADHRSIVKPEQTDAQLIGWLHRVIAERLEVRTQATREQRHAGSHSPTPLSDPRVTVVTRFLNAVGDSYGLLWEEIYNEVRRAATSTTVLVQDVREVLDTRVHLLVAVHDAALVVGNDPGVHATVLQAHAEQNRDALLSVGVCPVGGDFRQAEATVRQWLDGFPPAPSFHVNGAVDAADLREVLARLIQLVIGRDPGREI